MRISRTEGIQKKLEEGKKVILDTPEDIEAMRKFNESMARVHRDFLNKDAMSEIHARNVKVGPSKYNPPYQGILYTKE